MGDLNAKILEKCEQLCGIIYEDDIIFSLNGIVFDDVPEVSINDSTVTLGYGEMNGLDYHISNENIKNFPEFVMQAVLEIRQKRTKLWNLVNNPPDRRVYSDAEIQDIKDNNDKWIDEPVDDYFGYDMDEIY